MRNGNGAHVSQPTAATRPPRTLTRSVPHGSITPSSNNCYRDAPSAPSDGDPAASDRKGVRSTDWFVVIRHHLCNSQAKRKLCANLRQARQHSCRLRPAPCCIRRFRRGRAEPLGSDTADVLCGPP
jgi:hypothetical protein